MPETEGFAPKSVEDQAEFNSAFAFLERINKIEYLIEEHLMKWDLVDCFYVLESYENELFFSFKEADKEKVKGLKNEIVKILNENPGIGKTAKNPIGQQYIIGGSQLGKLRNLLILLNKTLRGIKHKSGMGMPTKGAGKLF